MSGNPGVWIAALLTLAVLSFLYKDNIFYRIAEHIFIGVSSAWLFATYFQADIVEDLFLKAFPQLFHLPQAPNYLTAVGGLLGLLILMRLIPPVRRLSRLGIAFIVGFQTGLQLFSAIHAFILEQLKAAVFPLFVSGKIGQTVRNWVLGIGTVSSLSYFYFSKEHKGWFGVLTRIGIWFLMISFGASYGSTVMTRMSILIGRVNFLLAVWLGVIRS